MAMSSVVSHTFIFNQVKLCLGESVTPSQQQQWQRQLDSAMSRVSLYPSLPPQAILVVRNLSDPLPGRLLAHNIRSGLRDWEQATQNALNDCWRTAVRPAQAPVPSTTNSVWFADQSEWLACLSWDIYRGTAGDRWWWQTALRSHTHRDRTETLFQLWQEEAQWLPTALSLLLSHHTSGTVTLLAELTPAQVRTLREQVVRVYQCPFSAIAAPDPTLPVLITALQPHLSPPVRQLIQLLDPETQALISVCLTLPNSVQLLQAALTEFPTAEASTQPQPITPPADLSARSALEGAPVPTSTSPRLSSPKIVAIQSTPLESPLTPEVDHEQETDVASNTPLDPIPSTYPLTIAVPDSSVDAPIVDTPLLLTTDLNLEAEQGIFTVVGGLWYLVNLLVALNWPGRTPILTPWHQLSILAQALLPEVPLDPVWGLLAEVAGDSVPNVVRSQWLATTLAQVHGYLAERLEQPDAISDYLLAPATLYLTRTHVDLVFSLDQIRLDVRMAGLDQDPGWVPELARAIAFHYE